MSNKLQPAVLGGVLIGVLSALPYVGACCCLWVIAGGVMTTYLLQERITTPVSAGDASIAGLLAGVIGAVISTLLSHVIALATGATMTEAVDTFLSRGGNLPPEMVAALEKYVNGLKDQETITEKLFETGRLAHIDVCEIRYQRAEAEIWLNAEKAR